MELELRHLKVIRAIDEAGSLTRAATSLGLAQSALSGQLKRLERALGGPLFVRDRQGARPTPLGELILDRARVLLPAVQQLQDDVRRFAHSWGEVPRFRIGGTHGPLLGALVDRISARHPQSWVSTYTSWSVAEICELVTADRLDFALIGVCGQSAPPAGERLVWHPVGHDPVFVMLCEEHPLAGEGELELGSLAAERWASAPGDGCFGDCFSAACARAGFTPLPLFETDVASCVHLVQVGRATGLCRATFPPAPGLVTVPLAGPPLTWRHLIGHRADSAAAMVAASVLRHSRQVHQEAVRRSPSYARWLTVHAGFGTAG